MAGESGLSPSPASPQPQIGEKLQKPVSLEDVVNCLIRHGGKPEGTDCKSCLWIYHCKLLSRLVEFGRNSK
jgi:hypothetical protein